MIANRTATRWASLITSVVATASLGTPAAHSDTATIKGGWNIGDPAVMVPSRCPCTDLSLPLKIQSPQDNYAEGAQRVTDWIAAHPVSTVMAFSAGTSIALGAIRDHTRDAAFASTSFLFLASPDSPRNASPWWKAGRDGKDGKTGPPTAEDMPDQSNITYVVREYDPVSDYPRDTKNLLAQLNLSVATHLFGYSNVNIDDPRNVVEVDPVTGRKTVYLPSDVLPILQGRAWYTSPAEMARLDAKYRPLIDAAYVGQRPVINAGPNAPRVTARESSVEPLSASVADDISTRSAENGGERARQRRERREARLATWRSGRRTGADEADGAAAPGRFSRTATRWSGSASTAEKVAAGQQARPGVAESTAGSTVTQSRDAGAGTE